MAEAVVSFLLNKLESFLTEREKELKGVKGDIRELRDELESMRSFLKSADSRQESDEGVKAWVEQTRDVAYDIEDVLDEFFLETEQSNHHGGFFGSLQKAIYTCPRTSTRERICSRLQEIKTWILKIKERSERYQFSSSKGDSRSKDASYDPRVASLYIEDTEFVSRDGSKNELIDWLVKGGSQRTVISVVGMGGIGKTTLVKKVFDDKTVERHFDCCAWITISQSFRVSDVMKTMVRKLCQKDIVPEGIDTMEEEQLIDILRNYLRPKRYVVVFDDVWSMNFWDSIQHALPPTNYGSRVLVTTRDADIASYCCRESSTHVCNLKPLPHYDAWELFCKNAFPSEDLKGQCPTELKELSVQVLKRCEGLPLAIVTIASLLSLKNKTVQEWTKLYDSLGSELVTNPISAEKLNRILLLSYNNMPYHLKHCFLYFSILPEDYAITSMRLGRLWIAEGFIEEKKGKTLEEVAEDYLNELIRRNLVQVVKRNDSGQVRTCRVHDLLREIILYKAKEERFCDVYAEQSSSNLDGRMRRLSILKINYGNHGIQRLMERYSQSHLRSLFMFVFENHPTGSLENMSFANFKVLRVLDLRDAPLENFPNEIVNLLHLRYLCLRNTKIKAIPKSLEKLRYLQTLDLKFTKVVDLPIQLSNLKQLRHLLCNEPKFVSNGVRVAKGIGCLTALQDLYSVNVEQGGSELVKELGELSQLRRLGVSNLRREYMMDLCTSIGKMSHLRTLCIESNEEQLIELECISSLPKLLQRLYLHGPFGKLSSSLIPSLDNLVKLQLFGSKLRDDGFRGLETLPNLMCLKLLDAYDGEELHFGAQAFPKLRFLYLMYLERLNFVTIQEGGLAVIQDFCIAGCQMLKRSPMGIQYLTQLQNLMFSKMPKTFQRRVLLLDLHNLFNQIPLIGFGFMEREKWVTYTARQFYNIMVDLKDAGFGSFARVCTCVSPFHHLFELTMQILGADKPEEETKTTKSLIQKRRQDYIEACRACTSINWVHMWGEEIPEFQLNLFRTIQMVCYDIDMECYISIEEDVIEVDYGSCWLLHEQIIEDIDGPTSSPPTKKRVVTLEGAPIKDGIVTKERPARMKRKLFH